MNPRARKTRVVKTSLSERRPLGLGSQFGGIGINPTRSFLFSLGEIGNLFGVPDRKVYDWFIRGLFKDVAVEVLVPRAELRRFALEHSAEYRLERVDQDAYKALLMGSGKRRK